MSSNFLQYLRPKQAKHDLDGGSLLDHSAGEELHRVSPGDTLWWVTARRDGELILLGKMKVWKCMDQAAAERVLRRKDLYNATYHAIAKPGTALPLRTISLGDIAPQLRFLSKRDRFQITGGRVNPQQLQKMRRLTPGSADLPQRKWSEAETADERFEHALREVGSGFGFGGTPEQNARVERSAIEAATLWYESHGWTVESVEAEKCGFDLRCVKGRLEENVEVKGTQSTDPCFIITSAEERESRCNARFRLCIVTSALSEKPELSFYTGEAFLESFDLDPLAYRARLRVG